MTSSRRSSRLAGKSLPTTPSTPSETKPDAGYSSNVKSAAVSSSVTPYSVSAVKSKKKLASTPNALQSSSVNAISAKFSTASSEAVTPSTIRRTSIAKSSKKYLSKFVKPIVSDILTTSRVEPMENSSSVPAICSSSKEKWMRKIQKHVCQRISIQSRSSLLSDEDNVELLQAQLQDKQKNIEIKIKQLSQSISSQITRSRLSTLPRLPDIAYESGQFEDKVGIIGDKINKISLELSHATKQLEERVMSFNQTYTIIKGNVDHLVAQQHQQQSSHVSVSDKEQEQNDELVIFNTTKSSNNKNKDPLNKLNDHLSAR